MTKIDAKLEGANIIEHMRLLQDMEEQKFRYFRSDSKLWKAIYKHIESKDCVLINKKGRSLHYPRGSGPCSVDVKNTHVYGNQYTQDKNYKTIVTLPDVYCLTIDVYFNSSEEYSEETREESFHINVPLDLEINFTQEKFDAWIEIEREKRDIKDKEKINKQLTALVSEYPKETRTILRKLAKTELKKV